MSPSYKRWYDHDPVLMKVLELLKNYQNELKHQAKETIEKFYDMVKPVAGKRWYDKDPVLSRTVELLRVVPPEVQRSAAEHFLSSLKEMGLIDKNMKL